MPIYEYQCEGCGDVFEVTQKMSEPPLSSHETCGSSKVKKLISQTSFQLKGSGWYTTDYKSSTNTTKSDSPGTKSDSAADTKTEKKGAKASGGGDCGPGACGGGSCAVN